MTNTTLVEKYLNYIKVQRRLAGRTQELYRFHLNHLLQLVRAEELTLLQLKDSHFRYWLAQEHAKGYKPKALALMLSSWRSFYTWLTKEGCISTNPLQDIKAPKAAQPLPKAMAVDTLMQLTDKAAAAADEQQNQLQLWHSKRDSAMLELLYSCGLRVSELTALDYPATATSLGWVDLADAEVTVIGKGNKQRSVPLGSKAGLALAAWIKIRQQTKCLEPALFVNRHGRRISRQSVWQRLQLLAQKLGADTKLHPHMLRHSFASHMLQSSSDLRAVQELLGHASISSTQIYTKLDFQHLAKIYDNAHPRAKNKKNQ